MKANRTRVNPVKSLLAWSKWESGNKLNTDNRIKRLTWLRGSGMSTPQSIKEINQAITLLERKIK